MTIDIIAAAQADRQNLLDALADAEERRASYADIALKLRSDVIETDQHIAWLSGIIARLQGDQPESAEQSAGPDEAPATDGRQELSVSSAPVSAIGSEDLASDAGRAPSTPEPQPSPLAEQDEPAPPQTGSSEAYELSQYDKVLAVVRKNPDANARAIAKLAGVPMGTARGYRTRALREIEHEAAKRRTHAALVAETKAPTIPNEPMRAVPPRQPVRPAAGSKFRLIDRKSGRWLHQSLQLVGGQFAITAMREHAWCGTERQMANVRAQHPETVDMKEEVVM